MTEAARRVPAPVAAETEQKVQGPVLIDPKLLKHIAGGTEQAPKGGWNTPDQDGGSAPKGGW